MSIELLNTWASFSRALYFSVCLGARDTSGNKITTNPVLRDYLDAQFHAAQRFARRPLTRGRITHRDEPNWFDKNTLITLMTDIGATNSATVVGALAYPSRVLTDLPSVRNFYGHRGEDTARKAANVARHYGMTSQTHPTNLCLTFVPGRPQSILSDWVTDVTEIIELAAT